MQKEMDTVADTEETGDTEAKKRGIQKQVKSLEEHKDMNRLQDKSKGSH